MTERISRYLADLPDKERHWTRTIGNPYIRAYDAAYTGYNDTLNEQKNADIARAELLIFSASVLSGSIMMAAFATTSLRTLAARQALTFICNRNLERSFNVMHFFSTNKAAVFALGKVLDEGKKQITKQGEDSIKAIFTGSKKIRTPSVINYQTHIGDFISACASAAHKAATDIRDNTRLSTTEKDRLCSELEKASFFNPPLSNTVDEAKLARKMELSFYLTSIIDSDYMVTSEISMTSESGMPRQTNKTPINQLPSARDYPRGSYKHAGGLSPIVTKSLDYESLGRKIRNRVDELHKDIYRRKFYRDQGIGGYLGYETNRNDLIRAEQTLDLLATSSRPNPGVAFAI